MTHFVIGVIIPKKIKQGEAVEDYIAGLMSPYSEELDIEPYIDKSADEVKKEFEEFKKDLRESISKNEVKDYLKEYVEDNKVKKMSVNEWAKSYYGQEVDKKGNLLTTYNSDCFWDWYRVGGRWDGLLTENEQRSEDGFNFSDEHETISNNMISVKDLLKKVKDRQAIIKSMSLAKKEFLDGVDSWNGGFGFGDIFRKYLGKEKIEGKDSKFYDDVVKRVEQFIKDFEFGNGFLLSKLLSADGLLVWKDFGWFGSSKKNQIQKDFVKKYIAVLEKHKDDFVVSLDCHI